MVEMQSADIVETFVAAEPLLLENSCGNCVQNDGFDDHCGCCFFGAPILFSEKQKFSKNQGKC